MGLEEAAGESLRVGMSRISKAQGYCGRCMTRDHCLSSQESRTLKWQQQRLVVTQVCLRPGLPHKPHRACLLTWHHGHWTREAPVLWASHWHRCLPPRQLLRYDYCALSLKHTSVWSHLGHICFPTSPKFCQRRRETPLSTAKSSGSTGMSGSTSASSVGHSSDLEPLNSALTGVAHFLDLSLCKVQVRRSRARKGWGN